MFVTRVAVGSQPFWWVASWQTIFVFGSAAGFLGTKVRTRRHRVRWSILVLVYFPLLAVHSVTVAVVGVWVNPDWRLREWIAITTLEVVSVGLCLEQAYVRAITVTRAPRAT